MCKDKSLKNYLDFRSTEEADKWGEKSFPNLVNKEFKKTKEFQALFLYGGNMFRPINRYLRGLQEGRDELYSLVNLINDVVLNNSTPENVTVYRSTHIKVIKKLCKKHILRKGLIFTDKAYFSTSLCAGCAYDYGKIHSKDCLLKLYLPKGTKGAYLSYKGTFSTLNEQEFLLASSTKFEIIKVHYFTKPMLIECKVVE
ncbi:MAG: hypothetical protein NC132_02915 [Corallococcus sp.]|nr:hypothetical protein [Corallococcus sp.]